MSEEDHTTIIQSDTDIYKQILENFSAIELFYKGQEYCYSRADLPKIVGRDIDNCDFVSTAATASRQHCTIIVKDGQIGIEDKSTNGTYIKIGRSDTVLIKNSFYPLIGQGHISLGEPIDFDSSEILHFRMSSSKNA